MSGKNAEIFIVTGPCGVGKSTISEMIAGKSNNSALIEGDNIYHLIVGGYVKPWEDDGRYKALFWDNVSALTDNFIKRNITVVLDYVIYPEDAKMFASQIKDKNISIKYTVLMADDKTIIKRDKSREIDCRMGERALVLLKEFEKSNIENKYILDTTNLTKEQVVRTIMTDDRFIL